MPQLSTTRRVRHAAAEMFDLVADVDRYPEFVPLCRSLTVRARTREGGKDVIVADMTVAYKFVRETFTSRVTLDRANLEILVEYLEGPFQRLNGSDESVRPKPSLPDQTSTNRGAIAKR
jgi:coenzyme Q-binding protein COQ10